MPHYNKRRSVADRHDGPRPSASGYAAAATGRRRQALRQFMRDHGLTPADLARRTGLPSANAIYNFLRGRSASLSQNTLERIARAFPDITVDRLAGLSEQDDVPPETPEDRLVTIEMVAAAGVWRGSLAASTNPRGQLVLPEQLAPPDTGLFGVMVSGPGTERIYAIGTILVCRPLAPDETPAPGSRVIVRRHKRGMVEVTVQEATHYEGKVWLCQHSLDPRHQVPVAVPSPGPGPARVRGHGTIGIAGIVLAAWQRELTAAGT